MARKINHEFRVGDKIAALYPMKRVPVMQLDDGEVLIDSAAILDWIDETVGPDRALIPPRGKARRDVLQICALAQSTLEKALAVLQEREQRPPELVHEPRLAYCKAQLLTGLAMLEARTPAEGWLLAGRVTQADITLASAYEFIAFMLPDLLRAEEILHIAAHHGRAAGLPANSNWSPGASATSSAGSSADWSACFR